MDLGLDTHSAEREGEGNATYARELAAALLALDSPHTFTLFAEKAGHAVYRRLIGSTRARVLGVRRYGGPGRLLWALGRAAGRARVDCLHVQYFAPLGLRAPLVVTVHDLAFLHVPASFPAGLRLAMRVLVPWSARRAARVITDAQFTAGDLARRYGLGAHRVRVVPLGARSGLRPPAADHVRRVLDRYGLTPGFVFSVGRLNPRKNLRRLLEAYALARAGGGAGVPLVIGGRADHGAEALLRALRLDDPDRHVRWVGLIPEADLAAFYAGAACFVYPSLFEGFGLPLVEAMACGCPVVSSDRSAMPEVVGGAGLLVDPEQPHGMAAAIGRVLADPVLADDLRERGLARARELTWERTARATLAVYEEVVGT